MTFTLIKERKTPPDKRVALSPEACKTLLEMYPDARVLVEPSNIRVFDDEMYREMGVAVSANVGDSDVFLGVKEVPVNALIPNKTYFFFSHTIKKQPYNRDLLRAVLQKNITFYDYETVVDKQNDRLIGFGYYAGIVGAYNGFRAYGLKYDAFALPGVSSLKNKTELLKNLKKIKLPNIKIVLSGTGKVGSGAKEILDSACIKEVPVSMFLNESFDEPVYTVIDVLDYNTRKDGVKKNKTDFYNNPQAYESSFMKFARVSDMFIAGHFYGEKSPYLFTRENAKARDFKIKVVADISCDIDGPVATTIRASTIENPIYGYDPVLEKEVDYKKSNAIAVMAVDNLPCELPDDASRGFGRMLIEYVFPAFFNNDKNGVLQRAKIAEAGKLTPRFEYLTDYVSQ